MSGDYGLRVGKTLRLNVQKGLLADDLANYAMSLTAAASDARMAGCALKVSTTINAALQSALLAIENIEISETDGIIERDIEKTIKNLATVASEGMEKTDEVILDIMTCK